MMKTALALLLAWLLVLTACAGGSPAGTALPRGGRLDSYTIADATGDWGFPSPYGHYARGPGYIRMSLIFETLVWKDEAGFVPQLAEDWEYQAGENAYVFKLRQDVKWQDGTDFTAEDVAFTFNYTQPHPYPFVDNTIVKSSEVVDRYTVKLYLNQPYASFLQDVAGTQPIIPRHIWENVSEPERFTDPKAVIGTGPYRLADYSKEHGTYLYRAFDGYYLGKPRVTEIKFVKVSAEMTPAALKEGSVNAGAIPPEVVDDMEKAGLKVVAAPVAFNVKMMMNHKKEPLSSPSFRQALAYAIDRSSLVQVTQRGHALAGSPGMMPPTSAWYNPSLPPYEYNPGKAKQLLEGLGYTMKDGYFTRDGQVLEMGLITTASYKDVGQFVARELEATGIRIDFETLEEKTLDTRVDAWDFDLAVYGHGGLYDPSIMARVILGSGFNSARYDADPALDRLLKAQSVEMDAGRRQDMVFQIQELYAEDLPALTLYYPEDYWAHDGSVNLFYTQDGVASGVPIPLNRLAFVR